MPFTSRQKTIDFPKKKLIVKSSAQNLLNEKKTPESKVLTLTASSSARKAFHDSSLGIVGREKELKELTSFLLDNLKNQTSGSMYISGLPGTGKTASVNYVIEKNALKKKFKIVTINCTSFSSSNAVFKRIYEGLKLKTVKKNEKESIAAIERHILKQHKMILLILDEVDQLECRSQSILYKIFEWPSWKNSNLLLIGIANAIDLTDRNLPRLCAKVGLKPILLHFAPYTKCEITEILKSRLAQAGVNKIFAPGAIELIAAKVAGTSGDIRRALDLGKRVVEIAEQRNQKLQWDGTNSPEKAESKDCSLQKSLKRKMEEDLLIKTPSRLQYLVNDILDSANRAELQASPEKRAKTYNIEQLKIGEITPQKCNISSSSPYMSTKSSRKRLDSIQSDSENSSAKLRKSKLKSSVFKKSPAKALEENFVLRRSPRKLQFDVDSIDVLNVVKNTFASSKNLKANEESSFPLHQKLLICTLLLIMKKGTKKDLNVGKVHQVYSKVCNKRGLTAVDKSGFLFLCKQVEVSGVLIIGKGPGALAKITLQWDESEVADALKDLNMMSSILNDVTCLT